MDNRSPLGVAIPRLLAAVAWFGVLLQLWLSINLALATGKPVIVGLVSYLGYFTILTNIFVAIVATAGSFRRPARIYRLPVVGCATAAIIIVGLGYHFLLREIWDPQGAQWVADNVLHYIVPAGALLHWFVFHTDERPGWRAPFAWCWYPLLYFVYVMTRGEIRHSYPYPFIDVLALGYPQALLNAGGFVLGFVAMGYALLGLNGRRVRWSPRPISSSSA